MNKQAQILIFGLLVLLALFIVFGSFFSGAMNENNLVSRYSKSMRAFWAAEAGLSDARMNLPVSSGSGSLADARFETTAAFRSTISGIDYYDVVSAGIVDLGAGGDIRRTLAAVVKTGPVDATKFQYGLAAANDLCFGGNCSGQAENYLDPDTCNEHACWKENDTTINFLDLFGYEQSEVAALATHYTESNFPGAVSGITWVDVTPGLTLMATANLTGEGILIVDGNVQFGGNYQFNGIIYVLGTLTALGTFDAYGSVIVASSVGVDTVNGTPTFHWNQQEIQDALSNLSFLNTEVVSWKEN